MVEGFFHEVADYGYWCIWFRWWKGSSMRLRTMGIGVYGLDGGGVLLRGCGLWVLVYMV